MEETEPEEFDKDYKSGYNKRTQKNLKDQDDDKLMVKLRHFTWAKVEAEMGVAVDTVVMDCEGCWVDLVDTYIDKFRSQVNTIILGTIPALKTRQAMRLHYKRV